MLANIHRIGRVRVTPVNSVHRPAVQKDGPVKRRGHGIGRGHDISGIVGGLPYGFPL